MDARKARRVMAQNIVVGLFEVESEAYQALAELRQNPGNAFPSLRRPAESSGK